MCSRYPGQESLRKGGGIKVTSSPPDRTPAPEFPTCTISSTVLEASIPYVPLYGISFFKVTTKFEIHTNLVPKQRGSIGPVGCATKCEQYSTEVKHQAWNHRMFRGALGKQFPRSTGRVARHCK